MEIFRGTQISRFWRIAVFKVIKFRESSNWCSFVKLSFLYLFNHNGIETPETTGRNVQQCDQHNIFKITLI